jgi:hypothetical protein
MRWVVRFGLVVALALVVAAGFQFGWTQAHFVIGGCLALFTVVAWAPTKTPAAVGAGKR